MSETLHPPPRPCRDCGRVHVMGCADCGADLDARDHYPDCSAPYYADEAVTVYHGDCRRVLPHLGAASVDAIVCDPPYELGFMGKHWDSTGVAYDVAVWSQCLRILKPGGYLLAFGGARTYHRMACAVEDAGFEMRDPIAWIFGQGFPKAKTNLKPAFEPIAFARKPSKLGVAPLNIDACRVVRRPGDRTDYGLANGAAAGIGYHGLDGRTPYDGSDGRWPPNVALDESQAAELDKQTGVSRDGVAVQRNGGGQRIFNQGDGLTRADQGYGGEGGASRFFPVFRYQAKAPTSERPRDGETAHLTVKPLDLMRWLVRLVTPPGGTVLEPFAGSGTTAEACVIEGFQCIAIEREADYMPLIVNRLSKPIQIGLDFPEETAS